MSRFRAAFAVDYRGMSQQGEKPAAHEDDWWRKLYDETAYDTGPGRAADSLDDRFDSVSDTLSTPAGDHRDPVGETVRDRYGDAYEDPYADRYEEPDADRHEDPYAKRDRQPEPAAPRTTAVPAPWEAPVGQPGPRTFAAPRVPEAPAPALAPDPSALHALPPDPADDEATGGRPSVGHLGDRPPTYDAEPAALPSATSENLDGLAPDTVLDGARYGTYTLRTASVRGDSARFRGEPRRDGLLTARFGAAESALVLVAVAGGDRAGEAAHLAAADACRWIGGAVARSHLRLSEDIRAGRRDDLRAGLHRLTDRTYGKLRARAAELGVAPDAYTASLRCLLLPADPDCRTRVFFGVGSGGLFRLRDGRWQDLEPHVPEGGGPSAGDEEEEGPDGDRLTMDLQIATPPSPHADGPVRQPAEPFRFRASVARPGDTLLLCSDGLAEPMRGEPALPGELAERWGSAGPPGLPAFLADTQLRIKGYADDRTCAAVWEA